MKKLYIVLLVLFYISIPLNVYRETISLLANGYSLDLAFKSYESTNKDMISNYYYAYKESAYLITLIARASIAVWFITFIMSAYVYAKKEIIIPFKLNTITMISSTIMVLFVLVISFVKPQTGVVL